MILMEATGNTQWSLPVLFTVSASKWAGDFFNRGIYDIHINIKHVPLLEPFAEHDMKSMRVHDGMVQEGIRAHVPLVPGPWARYGTATHTTAHHSPGP